MTALRQIIRGCGTLPHVGEHPGTLYVVALIGAGAYAGATRSGSVLGALVGAAIVGVVILPMYLYGAYERARISDRMEARRLTTQQGDDA